MNTIFMARVEGASARGDVYTVRAVVRPPDISSVVIEQEDLDSNGDVRWIPSEDHLLKTRVMRSAVIHFLLQNRVTYGSLVDMGTIQIIHGDDEPFRWKA